MSNERDARIALYLPIEIKAREFNSKVLLALFAANKGFRVYLGSKHAVDKAFLSSRRGVGGIYFYKSGNLRDRFKGIYSKCESLVVLDEEMGVAVKDLEFYYQQRISSPESISRYFVISDRHRRVASKLNPALSSNIRVTGWPRVDLWRPQLSGFYTAEVERLRSIYSKFVLFSSDFGFLNERRIADELDKLIASGAAKRDIDLLQNKWRSELEAYNKFVKFLHDFDEGGGPFRIIVRPHPAEDHAQWHSDLKSLKNVTVAYEGEIGPWMLASEALVHRGCTTAVQAYIGKRPSLYWCVDNMDDTSTSMLPYKLSTKFSSLSEFHQLCSDIEASNYKYPAPPEGLGDELYIGEDLAVELIVNELLTLRVSPEYRYLTSSTSRLIDGLVGSFREFRLKFGITKHRNLRDQYLRKLPRGITADEVCEALKHLDFSSSVKARQVMHNLVEIEN